MSVGLALRRRPAIATPESPAAWTSRLPAAAFHADCAESARATRARASRPVNSTLGSSWPTSTLPTASCRMGTSSRCTNSPTCALMPSDGPAVRPSAWRAVPNRSPVAARRSITTFFSSNGATPMSAVSSSASRRFLNGSSGLATTRPLSATLPCDRSRCRRPTSTFAPTIAVPTDSNAPFASRSANSSHPPTSKPTNNRNGPVPFQRMMPPPAPPARRTGRDGGGYRRTAAVPGAGAGGGGGWWLRTHAWTAVR